MKSDVLKKDYAALVGLSKKMKPEERLVAFFNHSRLIHRLYISGKALRAFQSQDQTTSFLKMKINGPGESSLLLRKIVPQALIFLSNDHNEYLLRFKFFHEYRGLKFIEIEKFVEIYRRKFSATNFLISKNFNPISNRDHK